MNNQEAQLLVSGMERDHKKHNDWVFAYEYPGFFVYYKDNWSVYFTPDWSDHGKVDVQINNAGEEDDRFPGGDIPFDPRTAANLFAIVRPFLDQIDGRKSVLDWEPD